MVVLSTVVVVPVAAVVRWAEAVVVVMAPLSYAGRSCVYIYVHSCGVRRMVREFVVGCVVFSRDFRRRPFFVGLDCVCWFCEPFVVRIGRPNVMFGATTAICGGDCLFPFWENKHLVIYRVWFLRPGIFFAACFRTGSATDCALAFAHTCSLHRIMFKYQIHFVCAQAHRLPDAHVQYLVCTVNDRHGRRKPQLFQGMCNGLH